MNQKLKMLKNNRKLSITVLIVFISVVGFALAYLGAQLMSGFTQNADIISHTTDMLLFTTDKDLSLNVNQFNLTQGGQNVSDSMIGTASLLANSTNNTANMTYNVYFQVNVNNYIYTTEDKKAEIILTILDPSGAEVSEVAGLEYMTVGDVSGFDITTATALHQIALDYPISSNSSTVATEQDWTFTVTYINLETNQKANANKTLNAEVIMSQKVYTMTPSIIATAYANDVLSTHKILGNYNITTDCIKGNADWDYKLWGLTLDPSSYSDINCSINYNDKTNVNYLNTYVASLEGTTQGDGAVVHEMASAPDYSNTTKILIDNFDYYERYYYESATDDYLSYDAAFTYNDGTWSNNLSAMTSNVYYYFEFAVTSSGYYEVCYNLSPGSSSNKINFFKNEDDDSYESIYASNSQNTTGCLNLGYISTDDWITIYNRPYKSSSNPMSTFTFNFKKANLETKEDAGIRYQGKDPNNYVWFNNELWRMIGVLGEESHGQTGKQLVKLIRAIPIGSLAWDGSDVNNWESSTIRTLLNGSYYDYETNGYDSVNCKSGENVNGLCDFTLNSINDLYRPMIHNATWYLGGLADSNIISEEAYYRERNENLLYDDSYLSEIDNYIGLMYPSDYGYAVLENSCPRITKIFNYNTNNCSGQNWLSGFNDEHMITHNVNQSQSLFGLTFRGNIRGIFYAEYGMSIRPVLYLDEDVYVITGDGTKQNPYILGM